LVQFESTLIWLLLIIPIAIGLVWIHYNWAPPWGQKRNTFLAIIRFVSLLVISILLLSPFLKKTTQFSKAAKFIIAVDDSESMGTGLAPIDAESFAGKLTQLQEKASNSGKLVEVEFLSGRELAEIDQGAFFDFPKTDLDGFLHSIEKKHKPSEVAGVLLISDGIFNSGLSPDFDIYPFPVHAVGMGNTSRPSDLKIAYLDYNRIAYTNSEFPVKLEYSATGFSGELVNITIRDEVKKIIASREVSLLRENDFGEELFYLKSDSAGRKKYYISLGSSKTEINKNNNSKVFYIDVIDDKKRILLAGLSPHPDIGAIRNTISEKEGMEFELWLPGNELDIQQEWDIIIFHQIPNLRGIGNEIYQMALNDKIPSLFIWGQQVDIRKLRKDFPRTLQGKIQNQSDEIGAYFNPEFSSFNVEDKLKERIRKFPPQFAPFGDYRPNSTINPILFQKIGSVNSTRPLFILSEINEHKFGLFLGNSFWKWRLVESQIFENSELSDLLLFNSIQFLVLDEEKKRFRFYPVNKVILEGNPVVFQSAYYNDIFEKTWGNQIELKVRGTNGQNLNFKYPNSVGSSKFLAAGLTIGDYTFEALTRVGEETFRDQGNFSVIRSDLEQSNISANHRILKNISVKNNGSFFTDLQDPALDSLLQESFPKIMTTRESMLESINLKWILFALVLWISAEWFFRKRWGGY
jgi:hypothetical protein